MNMEKKKKVTYAPCSLCGKPTGWVEYMAVAGAYLCNACFDRTEDVTKTNR